MKILLLQIPMNSVEENFFIILYVLISKGVNMKYFDEMVESEAKEWIGKTIDKDGKKYQILSLHESDKNKLMFVAKEESSQKDNFIYEIDRIHYLDLGVDAFFKKKFQNALDFFDKALSKNPKNIQAINYKGVVYANMGDFENAILNFDNALKIDPKNVDVLNNLGLLYYENNNFEKAEYCYNEALKIDEKNLKVLMNLGRLFGVQEKYTQAIEIFEKILSFNPPSSIKKMCQTFLKHTQEQMAKKN